MGQEVASGTASVSPTHHKIVALETLFVPLPKKFLVPAGHTYEVVSYPRTRAGAEVAERIRDADIVVMTIVPVTAADIAGAKHLKMISVVASGTDSVDLAACKAAGVHVANSPSCNEGAVAEHVVALYFSARRSVPLVNALVRAGQWPVRGFLGRTLDGPHGKPPTTCSGEVMGIVGYGSVGKRVEAIAKALGMAVLVAGRKGQEEVAEGRVPFDTVIRGSSVLVLCLPRSPETLNTVGEAELDAMPRYSVLVNVSRGGIVDEEALVAALKAKKIAGAATDVFMSEPASPDNSPLLAPGTEELNLVTTPHVAWCAEDTNYNYNETLKKNILTWLEDRPINTVV
ncbi:hypothetical protein KJ359_011194 [Pestalotiopsis sp. 9143b]|nr:hypothetical protein KJ359_011194 [Pestalotiopsis sp. 9143b]